MMRVSRAGCEWSSTIPADLSPSLSPALTGFFCCIMSTVLSGILTSLLLTHMIDMLVRQRQHAPGQLHLDGRVFLLAELALVALIALEALIFSRIEHWSYLDGLYFSVVTLLTIGFGDFSPSTTAGKILVFPFAIAGIALLANQISLIVSVSTRNMAKYRKQLHAIEEATVADLVKRDNEPYLQAEARRLHHITTQQRGAQDLVDLGASFAVLVVFWLVSAAIYHAAEGWPLGDALYFSYIFFLSIGYGDYSPSSPAGKTVFVFWALVAVPIMTNFVVTAIQSLVTHFSRFLTSKTSEKREEWEDVMADYFVPHPALISQAKERLDVLLQEDLDVCERCSSREDLIVVSRSDLRAALDESLILESRGRSILVDQMKAGSTAWLLLQADRNIQERYLSDVGGKDEVKEARQEAADEDILDRIAAYRQSWARWLVLGGRLMKLDEKGLSAWERRELRERDA